MLIQTTEEILDYQGRPFPLQQGLAQLTTVRDVVQMALNNTGPNEPPQSKEMKANLYRLTQLFYADTFAEITPADAQLIEERAGEVLSPLVFGRLSEIFKRQAQIMDAPSENGQKQIEATVE